MTKIETTASGPDGRVSPIAQAESLWRVWRSVARFALARGEGVAIAEDVDSYGTANVYTVYAPQWETVRIAVFRDGEISHLSEQNAPDVVLDGAPMPWEASR